MMGRLERKPAVVGEQKERSRHRAEVVEVGMGMVGTMVEVLVVRRKFG